MEYKDLNITEYNKNDFQGLMSLWEDIHLGSANKIDTNKIILNTIKNGGQLFVVKNRIGKVVGSSWITTDKRWNYLYHFGIRKEYRGNGLSRKLLEISLEFSKKNGLPIKLEVQKDNLKAIRLYEEYGFK